MKCPFCEEEFDRIVDLIQHARRAHPVNRVCPICGVETPNLSLHFTALSKQCEIHATFAVLYGKGRKRIRYFDLAEVVLERGFSLRHALKRVNKNLIYSIYDGGRKVLIRRRDLGRSIVLPFVTFRRIYDELPTTTTTHDVLEVAEKFGIRLTTNMHMDFLKVVHDLFGGELRYGKKGYVYFKSEADVVCW